MKKFLILTAAMAFSLGLHVEAAESETKEIKSCGNIFYESGAGTVRLFGEDIAFLQGKLATVPDKVFDPVLYSHTHMWEYTNITSSGHTKHCAVCGSSYDMTGAHQEANVKSCTISHGGNMYSGYEKECECGYKWIEEKFHNLIYQPKDDMYHTISCALAETMYCSGLSSREGAHHMTLCAADESHHQSICENCKFVGELQDCIFENEMEESDEGNESGEVTKYCECGNSITVPVSEITDTEDPDAETEEQEDNDSHPDSVEEAEAESKPGSEESEEEEPAVDSGEEEEEPDPEPGEDEEEESESETGEDEEEESESEPGESEEKESQPEPGEESKSDREVDGENKSKEQTEAIDKGGLL